MGKNENYFVRFIKSSGVFFAGSLLSKIISFLLLPLYTTLIPAQGMGIFDVSVTYINVVASFCFFELGAGVMRFMYDTETREGKLETLKSGFTIFSFSTFAYIAVAIGACLIFKIENPVWVLLYGFVNAAVGLLSYTTRGLGHNVIFAVSGLLNTFVHIVLNIVFFVVLRWDYTALYISFILSSVVQLLFLGIKTQVFREMVRFRKIDVSLAKSLFRYSAPLCLNTVAYWFLSGMNRIIYNQIYGDAASGVFSVGNKFGTLIVLATTCFTYAWQDVAFQRAQLKEGLGHFYTGGCRLYLRFLSAGCVLFLPALKLVFPFFVKGEYTRAEATVPLFIIVALVSGYSAFIGNIFYAIKDTRTISISTVISAVINAAIAYPLILLLGADGANLAVVISLIMNIMLRTRILHKRIGFFIDLKEAILFAAWIVLSYLVYANSSSLGNLLLLFVNGAIVLFIFKGILFPLLNKLTRAKQKH